MYTYETCLLLLPESQQTKTGYLDDLEADTRNITLGLTPTTEAGDQDLVVLVDEVQATIVLSDEPRSASQCHGYTPRCHHQDPDRRKAHKDRVGTDRVRGYAPARKQ